jgi:hypothetical protein
MQPQSPGGRRDDKVTRLPNRRPIACPPRRALTALALAALCALPAACGGSTNSGSGATSPAAAANRVGPSTMFTPSNAELGTNPAPVLDELKTLGVDTVHLYMHWSDIAPDAGSRRRPRFNAANPAAYPASGWANYDAIIRDTVARGMKVLVDLVAPPPDWASAPGAPDPPTQPEWKPSAAQFGLFVKAVGRRYSGHYTPPGSSSPVPRVSFWSIWNEPNLGTELAPQSVAHSYTELSGALYRGLVDAAWSSFKASGHGSDTILIGEIAPAGATFRYAPGLFAAMAPLRFLRALYCVGSSYQPLTGSAAKARGCPTTAAGTKSFATDHPGLFKASGFADHPYPQGLAPNVPTPHEPDYAELADLSKFEHALDTLQHVYGSNTKYPIYSTEYGYQTTPPDTEAGIVPPGRAAYYLNWSEYITWLNPRLRTYDQYLLTDPAAGNFATGLKFANGTPKPGYAAFRMPLYLPRTSGSKSQPLEVWGCVRPAHNAQVSGHATQKAKIQFASASGGAFKTVATVPITDRFGYFDVHHRFPGSGRVRLAWTYPHGATVFSRIVELTLR